MKYFLDIFFGKIIDMEMASEIIQLIWISSCFKSAQSLTSHPVIFLAFRL